MLDFSRLLFRRHSSSALGVLLCLSMGTHASAHAQTEPPPPDNTQGTETNEAAPAAQPATENNTAPAESPPAEPAEAAPSPLEEANALLKKRGFSNCKQAVTLYRQELQKDPNNADLQIATADAINCVMRIKTNGNSLLIEGTSDTSANKRFWSKWGKEAVDLAKAGYDQKPNDAHALAVYTDAFMFYSSSFGILKSAVTGAADEYKKNANALIQNHPKYDGGVGYVFLGAFYLIAPWPLSDKKLARELMDKALATNPESRRNNYYVGVVAYRHGDYERAATFFEKALTKKCTSPTERDFCSFMKKESQRALKKTQKELGQ